MKKITLILLFIIQAVALLVMTCGRNGPLPPPDKTPPSVVEIVPADGQEVVPINTSIVISFSKEMNPSTINDKTIIVSSYDGTIVEGTVSAAGTVAVFKPKQLLAQTTHYVVTINGTVQDTYGIPMGGPAIFNFITETLPNVVTHQPGSGVIDVPVNTTINIVFSEPVALSSVVVTLLSATTGTVPCQTDGGCLTTGDGQSYTYTPSIPFGSVYALAGHVTYTVIVSAGVQDFYGKVMQQDVVWSFTTALAPDTTPPIVTATTPTNGSSNVSVATGVTATFSELLTDQTMTVQLVPDVSGPTVICELNSLATTTDTNQTIAYFGPAFPPNVDRLEYYKTYTATLLNGSAPNEGVVDTSGNRMIGNYVWTFTTARATTSTMVDASDIDFGANGIVLVMVYADDNTAGAPTGNVLLSIDGQPLPQQQLLSSPSLSSTATATFTIPLPSAGNHALVATYPTQGIFSTSTGTGILTVNPGSGTTTSLQTSVNPSAFGNPVTFTATVSPGATGTVWFIDSTTTTTLGSGTLSRGTPNTATFTTSPTSLAVGAHSIIAVYGGDSNLPGSQSAPLTQNIVGASSSTNLIQSSATTAYGVSVTFTATVTSGSTGTPTGTVTFNDGATVLAPNVALNAGGQAIFSTTSLAGGQHTITATYNGSTSYGQSTSNSVVHTVTNQPTTTSVTSSANPSASGASVTFTATVNPASATGTVTFYDGASPIGTPVALSGGSAAVPTSSLAVGPHSITAVYNPGSNTSYATSTSPALSQSINPVITASAGTGGSISPSGAQVVSYGSSTTFTITPNTGYHIVNVLVNGGSIGAVTSYTFNNVTANQTITANFALNTYTITPWAGANGSINPATAQVVSYGSSTTFTFNPNSGYYIAAVTVDGNNVGLPNSYTFSNVISNHTFTVSFALGTNIITATAGAGGTLNSQGVIISSGTSQDFLVANGGGRSFTIAPNTGYHLVDVLVNGNSVGAVTSYNFTNVTGNQTITATFAINTYAVNVAASGPSGSGTVSPLSAMVSYGSTTTFTVTPGTGYSAAMSGTCGGSLNGTTYTTGAITAACSETATFSPNPYTLTVTKSGTGTGNVTPDTGALTWNGNSGTGTYPYNTTVTLTAAADISSTFTGWTNCDSVNGSNQCVVGINGARNVTATFTIRAFQVNVAASGPSGSGTVSPASAMVSYGSTTTFTVTPGTGYSAAMSGTCGGSLVGTTYTTGTITAACSETATFSPNPYTLTVTKSGTGTGNVTPDTGTLTWNGNSGTATYPYNTPVTLTAAADISSTFTGWTNCDSVNGSNQCVVAITAARSVTATFTINTYTIQASAGAGGGISPSGAVTVNYNGSQTFLITTNSGYHIVDVLVDNISQGPVTWYQFNNVTASHTISASFANTWTITASAGAGGGISPSGAVTVPSNGSQQFTITASSGYYIASILVDGVSIGIANYNISYYPFTNVTGNHTISATFALNPTITATAGTGGNINPSGTVAVNYGSNQQFVIQPISGYYITSVVVDGVSQTIPDPTLFTNTFNNVTGNHTISATFAPNPTITASAGTGGNINPLGTVTVNYGSNSPQFVIQPTAPFTIASVVVDGVPQTIPDPTLFTLTFYSVTVNHIINATFQ
jgi:hypothetical protein